MVKFKGFKNMNIGRIVSAITTTLVALYGGGIMLSAVGEVMNGTCSNLYTGLSLIGYTVGEYWCDAEGAVASNTINDTSGTGILAIVGIAGLMSIINQFVRF